MQRSVARQDATETRDSATQTVSVVTSSEVKGEGSMGDDKSDHESVVTAIYNPVGTLEPIVKDEGSESDRDWDQDSVITAIYNPVVPQKQEAKTNGAAYGDAALAGRPAGQLPPMDARFLDFLRYMSQRRKQERIAMGLISEGPGTREGRTHQK